MEKIDKHFPYVALIIVLLIIVRLAPITEKYFSLFIEGLENNKSAISSLQSISSIAVIFVGGLVSYYRFFRGRTFSTRLELEIGVDVIPIDEDYNFHAITLKAKNIGTLSIFNLKPIITIDVHGVDSNENKVGNVLEWNRVLSVENETGVKHRRVLDSGEMSYYFAQRKIPKSAWGVTYKGRVISKRGVSWKVGKTVANKETS